MLGGLEDKLERRPCSQEQQLSLGSCWCLQSSWLRQAGLQGRTQLIPCPSLVCPGVPSLLLKN